MVSGQLSVVSCQLVSSLWRLVLGMALRLLCLYDLCVYLSSVQVPQLRHVLTQSEVGGQLSVLLSVFACGFADRFSINSRSTGGTWSLDR